MSYFKVQARLYFILLPNMMGTESLAACQTFMTV